MSLFVRNNGLTLTLLGLFALSLAGHVLTGHQHANNEHHLASEPEESFVDYVTSGDFVESVFENWESEFFQMGMYIALTEVLFQKGSAESKDPDSDDNDVDEDPSKVKITADMPWPVRKGGVWLLLYSHSLTLAFVGMFLISMWLHAVGGAKDYAQELARHGFNEGVTTWQYLGTARFWFESFQNWQSEFLSVAAMVFLTVYLRQRGSPESKPVAAPHHRTGG